MGYEKQGRCEGKKMGTDRKVRCGGCDLVHGWHRWVASMVAG